MPDLWAFCEPCARWFYCARTHGEPHFDCPACGVPARTRRTGRPADRGAVAAELTDGGTESRQSG